MVFGQNKIKLFFSKIKNLSSLIILVKSFCTYFSYNLYMKFPEKLKELREEKGVSQMQLARSLGVSQSAIAKWELGKTEPTASALISLSRYFGETVDYLLGLQDD